MRFVAAFLALSASLAFAQPPLNPNERDAPPRINPQDKEDLWTLDFKFKDPRTLVVDIPGRGKTTVYYMWYQVSNRSTTPRFFQPSFELVTLEPRLTTQMDEVIPSAEEAIRKVEDPTGQQKIKNSVTIGKEPIPPSKPDAVPSYVTGVAIFPDFARKTPDTTRFSIFVSGLSNGWTIDDKNVVRRKTLQLNFQRLTDAAHHDVQDIKFLGPSEWVYRTTTIPAPKAPKPPALDEDK